jgi:uncharacterized protein YeeX (DUF496 family)
MFANSKMNTDMIIVIRNFYHQRMKETVAEFVETIRRKNRLKNILKPKNNNKTGDNND